MAKEIEKKEFKSVAELCGRIVEKSAIFDDGSPFSASFSKGDADDIVVIAGPNASGKSLVVLCVESHLGSGFTEKISRISISIRERTGSGMSEVSGGRRMFMFGDESESSTGAISVSVVTNGFLNVSDEGRAPKQVLILDEPEMGLSEGYSEAMGRFIAQKVIEARKTSCFSGIIVVTHSKKLLKGLQEELKESVSFLSTNKEVTTLNQYFNSDEKVSVSDLERLKAKNKEGWMYVSNLLKG